MTKIDERTLVLNQISAIATTDELTSLPNAEAFQDRLGRALSDAKQLQAEEKLIAMPPSLRP
jgi:GGDEF domain-containing protein